MWFTQKRVQLQRSARGCRLLRMNACRCRLFLRLGVTPVCAFSAAVLQTLAFSFNSTLAQELKPIADDTLGAESSVVTPTSPQADRIDGGAIRGANVFHSFSKFDIGEGREAYFANPSGIENILSRVTGSDASRIFGKLGVLGNANLFLINPNGIIFGRNASLDVRGSFVGTTANAIGFGDQGFFSATNPNTPELLTINPSAFFFNQIAAAPIQNNSVASAGTTLAGFPISGLRVPDGRSLLLVGGDISMDGGRLNAFGGRVELGGLAGIGTVELASNGNSFSLSFAPDGLLSNVFLTNQARVSVRGAGGGDIAVNANTFTATNGGRLVAGTEAQGNAGDITVNANKVRLSGIGSSNNGAGLYNQAIPGAVGNTGDIFVNAKSVEMASGATIESSVFSEAIGNGGKVDIKAESLSVTTGAGLVAVTLGRGDAGNIIINARERVSFDGTSSDGSLGSAAFSRVEQTGRGKGGDIRITTGELSVTNGAGLVAVTEGQGDAGNVIIDARERVSFDGTSSDGSLGSTAFSRVEEIGRGKGGDIRITTRELSVTNGAQLLANTRGQGDAGNVIIDARERVSFDGVSSSDRRFASAAFSSVNETGRGQGGDIRITTGELSVTNGAGLVAATLGQGDAGNVIIDARERVSFDGVNSRDGIGSAAFSSVEKTGRGKGGDIRITTRELSVTNGAQLLATTRGQGDAGNVIIDARERVSLDRETFDGKSIVFKSRVSTGVEKTGRGKGGDIRITARELSVTNGAQLLTDTSGQGDAGNVIIDARERISFGGVSSTGPSGVFSNVQSGAVGNGGSINITTTGSLSLTNGSVLNSGSFGEGRGSDVKVTAGSIRLDLGGIGSITTSGNGGNITLSLQDILLLRRNSQISTTAGTAQQPGNGGNITINVPNGFIVAVSGENSDITANAFSGTGGRVTINATDTFGIAPLSRQDLQRLSPDLDPRQVPTNDITAISQTNPSLSGTVELNTLEIDPNSALINLPSVPVDTELAQGCNSPNYAQSSFIITGRGGLPPNPKDILTPDAVQVDWVTLNPEIDKNSRTNISTNPNSTPPAPIVEATGWVFGPKGEVIFTAQAPTQYQNSWQTQTKCHEK
ncbi:filamentous hemagglutinin outer membrane protein [Kalymmatonema gypsitolerans NIES-4073]|nr:filamentous hemagglutinin outer membrane protein [Scytonema sp. NIES-4073]